VTDEQQVFDSPPPGPDAVLTPPPPPLPEREPFWGYSDLAMFIGLGLLCLIGALVVAMGIATLLHLSGSARNLILIPAQFVGFGLMFLVLKVLFRINYNRPFWRSLGWVPYRFSVGATILLGFALAVAISVLGVLMRTPDVNSPMKDLLARQSTAILIGIFGTTIGPLCEELGFRGFLQPLLVRSFGTVPGIILTAIPFGLLHAEQNAYSWRPVFLVTCAGIAFGWVRHITGSTRASTIMHAAYNFTFFLAFLAIGRNHPV
jgi:membrane protease YdiL (CAAX protease family)